MAPDIKFHTDTYVWRMACQHIQIAGENKAVQTTRQH